MEGRKAAEGGGEEGTVSWVLGTSMYPSGEREREHICYVIAQNMCVFAAAAAKEEWRRRQRQA